MTRPRDCLEFAVVAPRATGRAAGRFRRGAAALLRGASLAVLLAAFGCEEERAAEGPEHVVARFIAVMQGVHGDPEGGEAAVSLLWEPARKNLSERARRASAASGHPVKAGEMIAPSWFSLELVPSSYTSRVDGDWAEVTVRGDDPNQGQYNVRCVREADAWRVALELPPLAPIRKRTEDEPAEKR